MRLFLCGGGSGEQTSAATRLFCEIAGREKPLMYVPLALEPKTYPGCLEWINGELAPFGVTDIEMATSAAELADKDLSAYSGLFIGGGNTYKLLHDLTVSGTFDNIRRFIERDGVVFGGSAGAIIFGKSLDACALDDDNSYGDPRGGFDVLDGASLFCHYGSHSAEENKRREALLYELSVREKVIALPEEDTIFVNGGKTEVIGTGTYYVYDKGTRREYQPAGYIFAGKATNKEDKP